MNAPRSDQADLAAALAELERLVVIDPVQARGAALDTVSAADQAGHLRDRLHARRLLAVAYAHTNQFEQALATCQEAEALPGAGDAPVDLARVRLASMQPLANLGRIDDAITAGQTALQALEAHDGGALAGRAALNLGAIHAMTGRPAEALPLFDRARAFLSEEAMLLGQIETNRGTALAALDRFQEAEDAFRRASRLLIADGAEATSWAAAIAEGNLADLAAHQGAINRSLRHFEASRRLFERDEAFGDIGRINAEQAAVLATSGLTEAARDAFTEAIDLLTAHGAPADLARAQIDYAAALIDAGELAAAEALLTDTIRLVNADEQPDLVQRLTERRARLALVLGRLDEAAGLIESGNRAVEDRPVQRLAWTMMRAELARMRGCAGDATATLQSALDSAERARITPVIGELHTLLAQLAREAGDSDSANAHSQQAVAAFESTRGTIQANRLRQSYHHSRLRVYQELYCSLLERDDRASQQAAFGVAERIRSRMLLDAMRPRTSDVDETRPVPETERPLVEQLTEHRRWLNWMYGSIADGHEPDAGQLAELRVRERSAALLTDRLATLSPQFQLDAPLDLAQVQRLLGPDDLILAYLVVDDRLTLQAITRDRSQGFPNLARTAEIAELVAALQFQIGRALLRYGEVSAAREARLQRDADLLLSRLHERLIAPAAALLAGKRQLTVVPSGDLHSVPFAALLDGDSALLDRFDISTAPGVTVLARLRERRGGWFHPARPLIAGVPDDAAPALGEETSWLAGHLPHAVSLTGADASRDLVLAAMPGADLIHIACHGRFDPAFPASSGLKLADGWLTLDHLLELQLDQPLVLLTGCETGRVRVEHGDDLVGMMTALIAAGASGLVISLWKTPDAAGAAFVSAFYLALAESGAPITALRQAQQAVRRTWRHPAFWAPFVTIASGAREKE